MLHTHEATGSSPVVSTIKEKSELRSGRDGVRIFYDPKNKTARLEKEAGGRNVSDLQAEVVQHETELFARGELGVDLLAGEISCLVGRALAGGIRPVDLGFG